MASSVVINGKAVRYSPTLGYYDPETMKPVKPNAKKSEDKPEEKPEEQNQ